MLSHWKSCGWPVNVAKLQGPGLSVKFLGVVWSGKTKVIPDVVIDKTQVYPTFTVKQLQTFWGLLGYRRVFVPHLTQVVCPLFTLVKKGVSWDCSLIYVPLHALDPARPCELDVQVTQEGFGWGLWQ